MPTLSAYRNGLTMGTPGRNLTPSRRGRVTGWTQAAVRRHTRWLYAVDAPGLDGYGYAVTLTVCETPASPEEWQAARDAWRRSLARRGLVRHHWVVEWQRRGTPHLHTAVYFGRELTPMERAELVAEWVRIAGRWGATFAGQHLAPIDGPVGWLQYLSKHAARGVRHYQRQGKPAGWETSGRLWGHGGPWPTVEPLSVALTASQAYRFRRLVRAWRVANARAAQDWRRLTYARRMLRCPQRGLSAVRGVSEWVPEDVAVRLLDLVMAEPSPT